jgi:hypothetical protein
MVVVSRIEVGRVRYMEMGRFPMNISVRVDRRGLINRAVISIRVDR